MLLAVRRSSKSVRPKGRRKRQTCPQAQYVDPNQKRALGPLVRLAKSCDATKRSMQYLSVKDRCLLRWAVWVAVAPANRRATSTVSANSSATPSPYCATCVPFGRSIPAASRGDAITSSGPDPFGHPVGPLGACAIANCLRAPSRRRQKARRLRGFWRHGIGRAGRERA